MTIIIRAVVNFLLISWLFVGDCTKVIKISDFDIDNTYLTLNFNEIFTVEAESYDSSKKWYLKEFVESHLKPLNLQNDKSVIYYTKREKAYTHYLYHFIFQINNIKAHSQLIFVYKDNKTPSSVITKTLNLNILNQIKADL